MLIFCQFTLAVVWPALASLASAVEKNLSNSDLDIKIQSSPLMWKFDLIILPINKHWLFRPEFSFIYIIRRLNWELYMFDISIFPNIKMLSYLSKFGDPDKKLNNVFPSSSSLTQFLGIHHQSHQYPWQRPSRSWLVVVWLSWCCGLCWFVFVIRLSRRVMSHNYMSMSPG